MPSCAAGAAHSPWTGTECCDCVERLAQPDSDQSPAQSRRHAIFCDPVTFRTRILLATAPVVLVPLVVFGLAVRLAVRHRLAAQYRARTTALVDLIGRDLQRQGTLVASRLARLRAAAEADNRLRLAAVQHDSAQH